MDDDEDEKKKKKKKKKKCLPDSNLASATEEFPRLPLGGAAPVDMVTRVSASSLAVGVATYAVLPEMFEASRIGLDDELSGLLAAAATAFLATLRNVRALCEGRKETVSRTVFNFAKGGSGGLLGGCAFASLTKAALLSWLDGGILLVCTLAGLGGASVASCLRRPKHCPHCSHKGNCSHRVCRNPECYKIYYPHPNPVDCTAAFSLGWYRIASYLHMQGLSYLDADKLVRDKLKNWRTLRSGDSVVVECDSFVKWVSQNHQAILDYFDKGKENRTPEEIDRYLSKRGL